MNWRRRRSRSTLELLWMLGPLVARQGADHDIDGASVEFGLKIRMAIRSNAGQKLPNHLEPKLRVRHFTAPELEGHFHLHVLAKEINRVAGLDPEIVRINLRAKLNLFNLGGVLVFLGFLIALGLL